MIHFLKEWDAVGRALKEGRQILLARKGGILDANDAFIPAFQDFYLYPTYLHQAEQVHEALKPSEMPWYESLPPPPADSPPKEVVIRLFCRVVETRKVSDFAILKRLDTEHIWKPGFLEKRFEWGSEKGLTLLAVRTYEVDPPATIPIKPSFAGCKSWIEDDLEMPTAGLKPVLSDEAFCAKLSRFRSLLVE